MLYISFRNKLSSLRLLTKYHVKFSYNLPMAFNLLHSVTRAHFFNSAYSTYSLSFSNSSKHTNSFSSNVKPPNAFNSTALGSADSAPHQTEALASESKTHEEIESTSVGSTVPPLSYPHPYPPLDPREVEERYICGSGPGGQKINKRHNCVVLRHIATGITVQVLI